LLDFKKFLFAVLFLEPATRHGLEYFDGLMCDYLCM